MKKHSLFLQIGFGFYILGLATTITVSARVKRLRTPKPNTQSIIENVYANISGFSIDSGEQEAITKKGGAPTYGEIKYDSLATLLDDLKLTNKDIFYDLGCGVGKVCVQVALDTPIKKSIGIELSHTRINHAKEVKEILIKNKKLPQAKKLEFHEQNFADANIKDATVVFMCSTCFSDSLMRTIVSKMSECKNGLRIITLKELPPTNNFTLIKKYSLPMTWSENVSVNLYELNKKQNT